LDPENPYWSSSCLVRPAHVREVPVVLYKTRHPNESFSRPDGSSAAVVLQDNCMKVRKLMSREARSSSTVQTPLYQFRSLTALKYIPVHASRLTSPRRTISPSEGTDCWYGTPKRTDLVKDTQFCLQVNDGTVCKCRACPEDQHMRPDGFVVHMRM
jgi:hypothetical protein